MRPGRAFAPGVRLTGASLVGSRYASRLPGDGTPFAAALHERAGIEEIQPIRASSPAPIVPTRRKATIGRVAVLLDADFFGDVHRRNRLGRMRAAERDQRESLLSDAARPPNACRPGPRPRTARVPQCRCGKRRPGSISSSRVSSSASGAFVSCAGAAAVRNNVTIRGTIVATYGLRTVDYGHLRCNRCLLESPHVSVVCTLAGRCRIRGLAMEHQGRAQRRHPIGCTASATAGRSESSQDR